MKEKNATQKPSIIVVLCILAAALVAVHFARAAGNRIPQLPLPHSVDQRSTAKLLHTEALELPAQATYPVYKMQPVDEKKDKAAIIKALSLEGSSKFGSIQHPDSAAPSGQLGYDKYSGRWIYQTDIAYYTGENVPEQEKAVSLAGDFIREVNLYPADALGAPTVVPMRGSAGGKENAVLRWDVYYYPQVEGKPVYGVFRLCVSVGSDGKIVSVEALANNLEKAADAAPADIETVRTRIEQGEFMYQKGDLLENDIDLTRAELGYYSDIESEYILPVYILSSADDKVSIIVDAQGDAKW